MFYSSAEIDEDLKCAFCKERFLDVVKIVSGCGESICGDCYEELKENVDERGEFKCKACESSHTMPDEGFMDNRSLRRILKRNKIEKPLIEEAKTLKRLVESLPGQLSDLESFDDRDYIHEYCDQLEVEIIEEIDSLVKLLNDIQKDLLEQAREYRKQCLDSLSTSTLAQVENQTNGELEALSKEISKFNYNWKTFFNQAEANSSHKEIEAALCLAKEYEERISAFNRKLKRTALNGRVMEFRASHSFHGDPSSLRKHFCLSIRDDQTRELKIKPVPLRTLGGHEYEINQVIFISDNVLASCSYNEMIKVWNVEDGALLFELKGHTDSVFTLALLINGWLASGSYDKTIRLWDLETRTEIRTLYCHNEPIISIQVLKNGNLVSYTNDHAIRIWNPFVADNNLLMTITRKINIFCYFPFFGLLSNDNLVTIYRNNQKDSQFILKVWNSGDGSLVKSVPTGLDDAYSLLVLSNNQVAIGSENSTIKIIDLADETKTLTKNKIHDQNVDELVELPNGNLVSTGLDFDPDDNSQSISTIKIWSRADLNLLQYIETDHSAEISSAVVSPNGKLMATGSRDQTIKLWSISSV